MFFENSRLKKLQVNDLINRSEINQRRLYVAIALLVFLGLFAYRVALFSEIEPRSDQAFFSWWVQGVAQADHVFPTSLVGEGFMAALERDDESFLHRLLRPIHGKSITIFTTVPLALRLVAAWLFGDGIVIQTISSIFAGTLTILAIGAFPLWCFRTQRIGLSPKQINGVALLSVIVAGCTYYSHYFSPLGNHNFGVLFLVIAAGASQRTIHAFEDRLGSTHKGIAIAALLQFLALYSHWTNIFILPAVTLLVWSVSKNLLRRKAIIAGYYLAFLLSVATPFLLFTVNDLGHAGNIRNHTFWDLLHLAFSSGVADYGQKLGTQSLQWFGNLSSILSPMGLVLGLIGVTGLAIYQRIYLPLALCATHFLIAITLPIFIAAHFRTDLYVLPFLALGIAHIAVLSASAIYNFYQHRKEIVLVLLATLLSVFIIHHLWLQVSKSSTPEMMSQQMPEFWKSYYKGQGEIRPMAEEIDQILPNDAVIFTWGYGMQFFIRNYEIERPRRKIMPSLLTLIPRFSNETLSHLIKRRGLSIQAGVPIYALIDHDVDNVNQEKLRQGIENILGPRGFFIAEKVLLKQKSRWVLNTEWPRGAILYRVHLD